MAVPIYMETAKDHQAKTLEKVFRPGELLIIQL